jgi:uncharacterized GH25 family protein
MENIMNKQALKLRPAIFLVFVLVLFCPYPLAAHDLWLNIDNHSPEVDGKISARVVFGHNYPYFDILLTRDKLADFSFLCPDGKKVEVSKTWEDKQGEKSGALAGAITFDKKGTYVVSACLERKGDKEHVPSGKYGKSLIVVGQGTDIVSRPLGQRIEIIPLKNPTDVKSGESLPVRIFFEGKPLSTYVYATYAGYYSETEPFPVCAKSSGEGMAHVPISQPGTWMVVSNHKVDFSASLTFQIK